MAYAKAGADVAVNWLDDPAAAARVGAAIEAAGTRAVLLQGSVGDVAGARALVDAAAQRLDGWTCW